MKALLMERSNPEPQTEVKPPAPATSQPTGPSKPKRSPRTELFAYAFLLVFTVAAAVAYQVLETYGWPVALGAGVLLLEVGLLGFCILADRDSG